MGVQLSYDLVGAGWAKCTISVDDATATVTASYLSNALDDLASAISATLRGHPHATASFTEEPGEYRWIFEPLPEGKVTVRILEFKEMWGVQTRKERSFFTHSVGYALLPVRSCRSYRSSNAHTALPGIVRSGLSTTFPWDGWMSCASYWKSHLIVMLLRRDRLAVKLFVPFP